MQRQSQAEATMRVTLLGPPSLPHFFLNFSYSSGPIIALTGLLCLYMFEAASYNQRVNCQANPRHIFSACFALIVDMAISNISLNLNLTVRPLASLYLQLSF